jgi:hypothetical protein
MMTWYYYIRPDDTGYWTPQPPCYSTDRYIGFVDAAEMPTKSIFQGQIEAASSQAKAMNPYQGSRD